MGFIGSALITLGDLGGRDCSARFPWPLFVNAFALMNLVRVVASKHEIVGSEVRRLERKRAKELEARSKKKQIDP